MIRTIRILFFFIYFIPALQAADTARVQIRDVSPVQLTANMLSEDSAFLTVQGAYLKSNVYFKISGQDSLLFRLNKDSVSADQEGNLKDSVSVYFSPAASTVYSALLTISTEDALSVQYQLQGNASGTVTVENIRMHKKMDGLSFKAGTLRIRIDELSKLDLFDLNGRCIASKTNQGGELIVTDLYPGYFILRLDKEVFKILLAE